MRRNVKTSALAVLALAAGTLVAAAPAAAEDSSDQATASANEVAALVETASTDAGVSTDGPQDSQTITVDADADPAQGISVHGENTAAISVPTPSGLSLEDGVPADDGSVVYRGRSGDPDVTVKALDDGVRVSTVVWDSSQPASFTYPLPSGVSASALSDGSVELTKSMTVEAEGVSVDVHAVVGYIAPAWAIDADGDALATSYVIEDGVLTQNVDTTTATFPVVADPTWSLTSPIQVHFRFSRAETATIAGGGWGASGIATACGAAGLAVGGPAGAAAFEAACLGVAGAGVYTAGVAQNSSPKRCLEQFLTFVPVSGVVVGVPWFGTYACR